MTNPIAIESASPVAFTPVDAMSTLIERALRDDGISLDRLERLLSLRAEQRFNDAMAGAKGAIPPIVKNRVVDFSSTKGRTHYKFADLAEIGRVVDPILASHGLSYRYETDQDGAMLRVTCVVTHRDGHSVRNTLVAARDESGNKNAIQSVGSTQTFLMRYTLCAALGLSSTEDDDGRASEEEPKALSHEQIQAMRVMFDQLPEEDQNRFLKLGKVASLSEIAQADYESALGILQRKLASLKGPQGA